MPRSKTVQNAMAELYAVMAAAAARRAVKIVTEGEIFGADILAEAAGKWLDKSSAAAVAYVYRRPSL